LLRQVPCVGSGAPRVVSGSLGPSASRRGDVALAVGGLSVGVLVGELGAAFERVGRRVKGCG
jgi:hypothetical protein